MLDHTGEFQPAVSTGQGYVHLSRVESGQTVDRRGRQTGQRRASGCDLQRRQCSLFGSQRTIVYNEDVPADTLPALGPDLTPRMSRV